MLRYSKIRQEAVKSLECRDLKAYWGRFKSNLRISTQTWEPPPFYKGCESGS